MQLSKITIENFRGIKHAEIELCRDITVLIGENNVGKTTILEALHFCLDIVKSDKSCNFTEFDFYRDQKIDKLSACPPIKLTIEFRETNDHEWKDDVRNNLSEVIVGDDLSIVKLRITAECDAVTNELSQRWAFLDASDNEMPTKGESIKDLRRIRPFFFLRALRSAKDEFSSKSTYWSSFINDKDIDKKMQQKFESELFKTIQDAIKAHKSFGQVEKELKRLSALLSVGKIDAVSVDPSTPDIYKTIRYGTEFNLLTYSNAKIPLRSHGDGTQSLAVILLFNAYLNTRLQSEVDKNAQPIIAIEEPEAHLHPSAIRAVWQILKGLPGQKIIATHSGDILSEMPLESVRRINRLQDKTECKSIILATLSAEERRKFNHHVRRNRGELLFSKTWILVEGETDVCVLSECADILKVDFQRLGIRIIEFSQAGGPSVFIKIADALGINWHMVADGDNQGEKYSKGAEKLLSGRDKMEFISKISKQNMDVLLCCAGYGQPYLAGVNPETKKKLSGMDENTTEFWTSVVDGLYKKFSKPAAAMEALSLIREKGKDGVPDELKNIIEKTKSLTEEQ
jgi:putative ATP-dependent endonuclease of OLD family